MLLYHERDLGVKNFHGHKYSPRKSDHLSKCVRFIKLHQDSNQENADESHVKREKELSVNSDELVLDGRYLTLDGVSLKGKVK